MSGPLDYIDDVNFNTKNFPPISHIIDTVDPHVEKKIRVCRCWQSKKFPLCDDTHKVLVSAGDNVGPFNVIIKPSIPQGNSATTKVTSGIVSTARQAPVTFTALLATAMIVGYGVGHIARWSRNRSNGSVVFRFRPQNWVRINESC